MTFLIILGITEILCSLRLVLEGKVGKEIPESSRLEFLEKCFTNNFASSDAEDKTSWPLNIGGILLLGTLLAICQKSREPSFWEKMDSLTKTLLQPLLACLNFTLDLEDLSSWYK